MMSRARALWGWFDRHEGAAFVAFWIASLAVGAAVYGAIALLDWAGVPDVPDPVWYWAGIAVGAAFAISVGVMLFVAALHLIHWASGALIRLLHVEDWFADADDGDKRDAS